MLEHWKIFDAIAVGDTEEARSAMVDLIALAPEDIRLAFE
jgi:DNA-binding FadR family transcriptional regulator